MLIIQNNLSFISYIYIGLDPANVLFDKPDPRARLDKSDAEFVDNIHSNTKGYVHLGLGQPVGHVDFFPNKGADQPPCEEPGDMGRLRVSPSLQLMYLKVTFISS